MIKNTEYLAIRPLANQTQYLESISDMIVDNKIVLFPEL